MSAASGPDFICIGMQKAGTGWLFDQLQYHPDFWMPPVKEIHYLDRDPPKLENAQDLLFKARNQPRQLEKRFANRRRWDDRDLEFLEEAAALAGKPQDLESYRALFRFKGKLLSGDITPVYTGLSDDVVAQVGAKFPDVRIVLLLRDPVSRTWSQLSMAHRSGTFNTGMLKNPDWFRKSIERSKPIRRVSFPAGVAERWQTQAPNVRLRHFFFEDIAERPAETRGAILEFIGADPEKSSGELTAGHNKKSNAAKLTMTDDIKAVLADFFADEIRACARRFGGHAITWAKNYGISL